jgi:hypothetical protein
MRRPFSRWERFQRGVRHRLITPMKRSRHPPEFTARGVAIGVFWAFTPLIGIQMYLVMMTWALLRWWPRWDFNPIVALPWTWITNVFTLLPTYYVFYVTGELMMGRWDAGLGYDGFVQSWQSILLTEGGFLETMLASVAIVAKNQGLPMVIGSIPYAIGLGWISYRWSLVFVRHRRHRRALKRAERDRMRNQAPRRLSSAGDHRAAAGADQIPT